MIPGLGSARRVKQTVELFGALIPAAFWQALKAQGLMREDAPVPGEGM